MTEPSPPCSPPPGRERRYWQRRGLAVNTLMWASGAGWVWVLLQQHSLLLVVIMALAFAGWSFGLLASYDASLYFARRRNAEDEEEHADDLPPL